MITKRTCKLLTLLAGGLFALAGCGGSGGGAATGTLNIGLTDGPVDSAEAVYILFTGLEVKPAGGPSETYDINPAACDPDLNSADGCFINLLDLSGMEYRTLFAEDMPAGEYQWVRLLVKAEQNVMDSYVILDETENSMNCSLWIPSGSETGLKIVSGMTVTANGQSNYMLDFDVRKSITAPPGLSSTLACAQNYVLKPAIRMVDETEAGSIAGIVSADILTADFNCRDADEGGVVDSINVYVFEAFDSGGVPVEVTADDYDGDGDPIASAIAESNDSGLTYEYEVGYLLEGDYKLGLTCTADVDVMPNDPDPKVEDNLNCDFTEATCEETTPPFSFIAERDVNVAIDAVTNGDFPEPQANP